MISEHHLWIVLCNSFWLTIVDPISVLSKTVFNWSSYSVRSWLAQGFHLLTYLVCFRVRLHWHFEVWNWRFEFWECACRSHPCRTKPRIEVSQLEILLFCIGHDRLSDSWWIIADTFITACSNVLCSAENWVRALIQHIFIACFFFKYWLLSLLLQNSTILRSLSDEIALWSYNILQILSFQSWRWAIVDTFFADIFKRS